MQQALDLPRHEGHHDVYIKHFDSLSFQSLVIFCDHGRGCGSGVEMRIRYSPGM